MIATKKCFLLLILTLLSSGVYGQVADSTYYNRLFYTAKVWGYVKYYHTSMEEGTVDWDEILLTSIDGIKSAPDNASFNDSLYQVINQAGPMEIKSTILPNVPDSLNNNSDKAWMNASIFSEPVRAILDTIRVRFRPQNNSYVGEQ